MNRNSVIAELGAEWEAVQEQMGSALKSHVGVLNDVNGSVLANGGKQLRPMLCLLMAHACGRATKDSVLFAAATELLHNASLMHDDVADDSKERRGRPSLQTQIGATGAVLVGDFWLARTVEIILGAEHSKEVTPLFSKTLSNLTEGEMLQLEKTSSCDTTEEEYLHIIYCKTASLFESACVAAAISADAPEEYRKAAGAYAKAMGMAFQIKDDILDYAGDTAFGKPIGIDLREKKITLPLLGVMKDASREAEIRTLVREMDSHPENVDILTRYVMENGGVEYAAERLDAYIEEAVKALDVLPDSRAKAYLIDLVRYNAFRTI